MPVLDPPRLTVVTAQPEPKPEEDDKGAAWAFLWTLFVFKMATVFVIFWASKSFETGVLLTATTLPWLVIPALLCVGPLLFRYRLLRMRARRRQLRRAEWMLDEDHAVDGAGRRPLSTRY
jgi:hypothetical protein